VESGKHLEFSGTPNAFLNSYRLLIILTLGSSILSGLCLQLNVGHFGSFVTSLPLKIFSPNNLLIASSKLQLSYSFGGPS
jgi:hypothetical protein